MNARLPIGVESLNRGFSVADIESRNTMISLSCLLAKAGLLFGSELKALMDELNGVLVS